MILTSQNAAPSVDFEFNYRSQMLTSQNSHPHSESMSKPHILARNKLEQLQVLHQIKFGAWQAP